ncbi:hypothetical protein K493DRAFT_320101 [Basidiobolus meristosporus CBS 931.73]|uniref:Uncharacterized protein n=1 Tax=Basidiobolus meristosporus CBS 931.73 TaxID=1314790 RepID=A0A1Y1XFI8_9FUNG|nr:hypothetical protein K493DRAFT_320101 [Basidiobolus meristosporus CBS 931.73]|eukprot:ORX84462.1 hypothetical protein K493DRAFT_320101 [Basidiobolus meristosporus CBS 931.73]
MYKHFSVTFALLIASYAVATPVQPEATNVASASISIRDPQSGKMITRFQSTKDEDARAILDDIFGQMSGGGLADEQASPTSEDTDSEEAELWGRYGGYGRWGSRYWGRGRYGRYGGYGGRWGYGRYGGYGGYGGCDWGC